MLVPTDDAGSIFLAEHGDALRARFLFPGPPRDLPRRVAGKYSLHQLCRELGMPSPLAAVPESLDAAARVRRRGGLPADRQADHAVGRAAGCAAPRSWPTPAELDDIYRACAQAGVGLMLQEFIPGGPGQDWFFHGYCDASSTCRPAFTGVKERSYPAHAGLTCLGRSAPNDELPRPGHPDC